MARINLNKIDLFDKKDQTYYTTQDIAIPAGTRIENWSNEQKDDSNRFEMIVPFGQDHAIELPIRAIDLRNIIIDNPDLFDTKKRVFEERLKNKRWWKIIYKGTNGRDTIDKNKAKTILEAISNFYNNFGYREIIQIELDCD